MSIPTRNSWFEKPPTVGAIHYRDITIAFLGRRTTAYCRLCRAGIGHYPTRGDATSEADRHLRRYHREQVPA